MKHGDVLIRRVASETGPRGIVLAEVRAYDGTDDEFVMLPVDSRAMAALRFDVFERIRVVAADLAIGAEAVVPVAQWGRREDG
jgi:hypothetical protein